MNPSVEAIFKFAHLRSKDFSFQTKSAHSDSPSAGGAGELCWKVTRQRMSSLKRSMCGRLWPDWRSNTSRSNTLVGRATRRGKCGSYLNLPATRRMSPKAMYAYCSRDQICVFLAIDKLLKLLVARDGIEPPTPAFSGPCSTN